MINNNDLQKWIYNGASLTADLQPMKKANGFMVSMLGYEKTYKPTQTDEIKTALLIYSKLLKHNQYIGIWYNNDKDLVYIDISKHYANKQDAIKNGVKNYQYSIYDLKNQKDIDLIQKTYILYYYSKIKNDIQYRREFKSLQDLKAYTNMTTNTLSNYIMKSIDEPIKKLYQDMYIIIQDTAYIRDLQEI